MYCNNCGYKNDDQTSFCVECGSRLEDVQETIAPKKQCCGVCGNEIEDGNKYCDKCGASLEKKKHNGRKIGVAVISVLLVIVLACTAVFGYNMLGNPMLKIQKSAKNTLGAKNAEFELTMDTGYDDVEIDGEIELNLDKEYLCLHMTFSDDYDDGEVWLKYEDSDMVVCSKEPGEDIEEEEVSKEEKETLKTIFKALKGETDSTVLRELLEENNVDEHIYVEKIEKVGKQIIKKLASKKNMENILGYSESKRGSETVYSFRPDLYKLVIFLIDNSKELFKASDYEDILDQKDQMLEEDDEDLPKIDISLMVEGKYLTGYKVKSEEFNMDVRLDRINKTAVEFPEM